MIIEKTSQNKGVTLVGLVITIIILLILSGVAVTTIKDSNNIAPYNNMIADITLLEDKILVYYNKYRTIPFQEGSEQTINDNDTVYYKIDISKLENITLNYGNQKDGDITDIYLVSESLEVYYLKGVKQEGIMHHTK